MADDNGATGAQADPVTQPPAGSAKSQADDAGDGAPSPEVMSLEEAKKLRTEAQALRKRLHELETKATKDAEATLSEQEKAIATARREAKAEAMGTLGKRFRQQAVRAELAAAGANLELLDLAANDETFADLPVTDDGEVEGVKEAVAAFKKSRPSVFVTPMKGAGSVDAGARGTTVVPDTNALLRAAVRGR